MPIQRYIIIKVDPPDKVPLPLKQIMAALRATIIQDQRNKSTEWRSKREHFVSLFVIYTGIIPSRRFYIPQCFGGTDF